MAEDDDGAFTFGDFNSVPPQNPPINGRLTSSSQNDDVWGDFFFSQPNPSTLSHHSSPDLFGKFSSSNQFQVKPDPGLNQWEKPKGALPLSLFGEVEEEVNDSKDDNNSNGMVSKNSPAQNGKFEGSLGSNGVNGGDLFGKLDVKNQEIKSGKGLGLEFDGLGSNLNNFDEDDDDDDGWEFKSADAENGVNGKLEVHSVSSGSKMESMMINQGNQAGQDASIANANGHKPVSSSSMPQFFDPFATHDRVSKGQDASISNGHKSISNSFTTQFFDPFASHDRASKGQDASISNGQKPISSSFMPQFFDPLATHDRVSKSSETGIGFDFNFPATTTKDFVSDLSHGAEKLGNGNGTSVAVDEEDDFDDFGDFVDASQENGSQGQEHAVPQTITNEVQFCNGMVQDKQKQPENDKGALPPSLFSDFEENSNETKFQDEMILKPVSNHGNRFSNQTPGVSIHDLISNLYSQTQHTSSVDANQTPAGVKKIDSILPSDDDDDGDDGWKFKDAFSNTGVKEQMFSHSPGNGSILPSETSSTLQFYMDFYATLKEALCFLLSHQLEEEKKAQSSGSVIGNDGKAEALGYDIQEAYKLLEECKISHEVPSKKHLEQSTCLDEILEALQGPRLNVIESEYSLSKRLQLAANEWRVTTELLRHAISIQHILSFGSVDEQSIYVSTWSKLLHICCEELKYGASIWKRALEKNVQHQVLSDHRGLLYIRALGEIYRVVKLLGLSIKLYKPWVLLSVSQHLFGLLDECQSLWSSSRLEVALQNNFECNEQAKALIASIKNIRDLDMFAVHDLVFIQQKSVCQLSLLPQEMLADLKTVLWNEESYFLNLANLWANLISCNPPGLPHLRVTSKN